jgi:hypothetical protein
MVLNCKGLELYELSSDRWALKRRMPGEERLSETGFSSDVAAAVGRVFVFRGSVDGSILFMSTAPREICG